MAVTLDLIGMDGASIPSEYNVGVAPFVRVELRLTVTSPDNSRLTEGVMEKNGSIIGRFDRTATGVFTQTWFGGHRQPIYVKDGDVLSVRTTTATVATVEKTIVRGGGSLVGEIVLPTFINKCRELIPDSDVEDDGVIAEVIGDIELHADIEYSRSHAVNCGNIERYVLSEVELPPITVNIFADPTELQEALDSLKPITQKEIFDTWPRFSLSDTGTNHLYWGDPSKATGDAKAWVYDANTGRVRQPPNAGAWTGFLSQKEYDRYDHEVNVLSTDGDDDFNGIVLGHIYKNGYNHLLCLIVSTNMGGTWTNYPYSSHLVIFDDVSGGLSSSTAGTRFIVQNTNDPKIGGGWSNRWRRCGIQRRGDVFTVDLSDWNSAIYNPSKRMIFDLNSHPRAAIFKDPCSYGYINCSQANSQFYDIVFDGGERADTITYGPTGEVYTYNPITGWSVEQGLSLVDIYGAPRVLVAESDGTRWRLNVNGSLTKL